MLYNGALFYGKISNGLDLSTLIYFRGLYELAIPAFV